MVESMAVALHAVELTSLVTNDSAAVIGAGIIGLCIIQILKIKDCSLIIAVDVQYERLVLAQELGATDVVKN